MQPLNSWLIAPKISILEGEDVNFSFRLRTLFNNGDALKLWVTNNYSGDITTSTWQQLELNLPRLTSNYVTFTKTISCVKGDVYMAFEYKGYDSVVTSTYDIDDVKVYKSNVIE